MAFFFFGSFAHPRVHVLSSLYLDFTLTKTERALVKSLRLLLLFFFYLLSSFSYFYVFFFCFCSSGSSCRIPLAVTVLSVVRVCRGVQRDAA